jgi:hypothetical protein
MAKDVQPPDARIVSLVTAVIAFLDTDAAFGPGDQRTIRAKSQLRTAVERLGDAERSSDPPRLRVIHGGERS